MAARSLSIVAQILIVLLAIGWRTSNACKHKKAAGSYGIKGFFATASASNSSGTEPLYPLPTVTRGLKASVPVATDDATLSKKGNSKSADDETKTTVLRETDDGSYLNKTSILPPETDQPRTWPAAVLVLFIVVAAVLFAMTGYRNCKKRSQYQDVSSSTLVV